MFHRFDNAAKLITATAAVSLCRWLGEPTQSVRSLPTTLPEAKLDVDWLAELSGNRVLTVEFQTDGEADYPLRALEYTARIRRLPDLKGRSLTHHVIVLRDGYIDDHLVDDGLRFFFHVHYLRQLPVDPCLADPALAPFATLADVGADDRPEVFRAALRRARDYGLPQIAIATRDLAHLRLDPVTINEITREEAVPIPTAEYHRYHQGLTEGRQEGRQEGQVVAVAAALRHRFGDDPRINAVATRLVSLDDGSWFERFTDAASLDDLAG